MFNRHTSIRVPTPRCFRASRGLPQELEYQQETWTRFWLRATIAAWACAVASLYAPW